LARVHSAWQHFPEWPPLVLDDWRIEPTASDIWKIGSMMTTPWYLVSNVDDIPSPALLVYPDRVRANLDLMIEYAGGTDHLRPHVKTHKMSEIIAMQLGAGISKFKVATIAEAEMVAAA